MPTWVLLGGRRASTLRTCFCHSIHSVCLCSCSKWEKPPCTVYTPHSFNHSTPKEGSTDVAKYIEVLARMSPCSWRYPSPCARSCHLNIAQLSHVAFNYRSRHSVALDLLSTEQGMVASFARCRKHFFSASPNEPCVSFSTRSDLPVSPHIPTLMEQPRGSASFVAIPSKLL